uniref:RNA polymerase sigma-70 factor n=1 Tax=uncultured Draconibacterium sp. TaxID=1573823 RepID=UPI003216C755
MQKINGLDESKLINRLKKGDQTAFEILFRYYYPGLVVFASQITLDKDEATEIVQDFFVRLWEKRSGINDNSSLKSYFFTSVKNRSLNYLKKIEIQSQVIDQLKNLTENNQLYEPDIFVESELQEKIKVAIGKLPARCGEIFVMSRFQGLTNDEIATKFDISKRTVETQISNALKVLRIELKDYVGILILLGITNL